MATTSTSIEESPTRDQMGFMHFLRGTSFLALEHTLYMLLVVAWLVVLICALQTLCGMWSTPSAMPLLEDMVAFDYTGMSMSGAWFAAALMVLSATLAVLYIRTHAEIKKRPDFTLRLSYKLPVYIALGLLTTLALALKIMLIGLFFYSIVAIGTSENIANIYLYFFLPALAALALVCVVGAYVWKLARGFNFSRKFVAASLLISVILAVTLLITSAVKLHEKTTNIPKSDPYPWLDRDYFKY